VAILNELAAAVMVIEGAVRKSTQLENMLDVLVNAPKVRAGKDVKL
jgi:hypothetical protein